MAIYRPHDCCRACRSELPNPAIDFRVQPLANDYRFGADRAPLAVSRCLNCGLGQLRVVVDPEVLYKHYYYVTSNSETMRRHFAALHHDLGVGIGTSVVEIGSNDGLMLSNWKDLGMGDHVGVDPSIENCEMSVRRGIPTMNRFFNEDAAGELMQHERHPDLVIARHVFAHIDDWHATVRALELLAGWNTTIAIEVPYAMSMLARGEFDTIYHEHLSYVTVKAIKALLLWSSIRMQKVIEYPIHGGSIVIILKRASGDFQEHASVDHYIGLENANSEKLWWLFKDKVQESIEGLRTTMTYLQKQGATFAGYGAPAKSAVLIHAAGLMDFPIKYISDTTPQKQGKMSPGTHIPIVSPEVFHSDPPSHAIVFPWNFATEIMAKEDAFRKSGGRFIVPIPSTSVY